jgi:hypothetical protein
MSQGTTRVSQLIQRGKGGDTVEPSRASARGTTPL